MNEPKYRRVLLKISGEALAGDAHRGLNFDVIGSVCDVVKQCVEALSLIHISPRHVYVCTRCLRSNKVERAI